MASSGQKYTPHSKAASSIATSSQLTCWTNGVTQAAAFPAGALRSVAAERVRLLVNVGPRYFGRVFGQSCSEPWVLLHIPRRGRACRFNPDFTRRDKHGVMRRLGATRLRRPEN
jgi:hypothetical protein